MKAYVKYVIAAAVAGLGVFLFYLSAVSWGQLLSTKDKAMFFLEQPLSVQDAEETVRNRRTARGMGRRRCRNSVSGARRMQ